MIDDLPPLREVIRDFELDAKKSLGQNFLLDLNLTSKIARSAGSLEDYVVIEIGPGPGGLTRALLAHGAAHVIAIERDSRCIAALQAVSARYPGRLTLIEADAMRFDPLPLLAGRKARIVANLPYNIGTQLLIGWLRAQWPPFYASMTLMFQREVARRIVARETVPDEYGRLGILANWRCETKILFDLPPSAFTPPPKVTSSVVSLIPRATPEAAPLEALEKITGAAFAQRRKMLRQSLKSLGNVPDLLAAAGLDGSERPENLPLSAFLAMANALGAR
ncbi:MAG: 16S rRNA (adenine(1518)-N(6)/adenine(1519)-N(6))-dimethyltransferase RsmA [Proteobacteria bacterium]|nr:16S rRNA (adenine(1518)-N(6)/adenine(1519)-N(6))-dimethyltransferase RsmA [Pseudomonadota bacterium]